MSEDNYKPFNPILDFESLYPNKESDIKFPQKLKKCVECGNEMIAWYFIYDNKFRKKFSYETLEKLWNSDLIQLKCCDCYGKERPIRGSSIELLQLTWGFGDF